MKAKFVFIGILILLFQDTLLFKFFSLNSVYPSFIRVFLALITLKFDIKNSLKYAVLFGIVEDLYINSLFFYNLIVNIIIVYIVQKVKYQLDFSSLYYGTFLIFIVSFIDISFKETLLFAKTGIFYISPLYIIYSVLNVFVFIFMKTVIIRL